MKRIFLGTDSGATTSKTCGVNEDGSPISLQLAQSSTRAQDGTEAVIRGWMDGLESYAKISNDRETKAGKAQQIFV